jgi:hypothetical protein
MALGDVQGVLADTLKGCVICTVAIEFPQRHTGGKSSVGKYRASGVAAAVLLNGSAIG